MDEDQIVNPVCNNTFTEIAPVLSNIRKRGRPNKETNKVPKKQNTVKKPRAKKNDVKPIDAEPKRQKRQSKKSVGDKAKPTVIHNSNHYDEVIEDVVKASCLIQDENNASTNTLSVTLEDISLNSTLSRKYNLSTISNGCSENEVSEVPSNTVNDAKGKTKNRAIRSRSLQQKDDSPKVGVTLKNNGDKKNGTVARKQVSPTKYDEEKAKDQESKFKRVQESPKNVAALKSNNVDPKNNSAVDNEIQVDTSKETKEKIKKTETTVKSGSLKNTNLDQENYLKKLQLSPTKLNLFKETIKKKITKSENLEKRFELPKFTVNLESKNVDDENSSKNTNGNIAAFASPVKSTISFSPVKVNDFQEPVRSPSKRGKSQSPKVHVNNYPIVKPFNITVNVATNNSQQRKVEFCGGSTDASTKSTISPSHFEYDTVSCERSITTDYDESMAALQFYAGEWFFDISEEELCRILTSDGIFKNAVLSSGSYFESTNTSPSNSIEKTNYETDLFKTPASSSPTFQFTKPILPPAKRPPTRIKPFNSERTVFSSSDSVSTSTKSIYNTTSSSSPTDDKDDVISLYSAWSIKTSDFSSCPTIKNDTDSDLPQNSCEESPLDPSPTAKPVETSSPIVNNPKDHVMQWLETTQPRKQYYDFNSIPSVFRMLCFFYYTYGNCYSHPCKRLHVVTRMVHSQLSTLNPEPLMEAYNFAKARKTLFTVLINTFTTAFLRLNNTIEIIDMVSEIMYPGNTKLFHHLKRIINALQESGFSFAKAIDSILQTPEGTSLVLSNILFKIICEEKADLCANWPLIEKLCRNRNSTPFDPNVLNDVLVACYECKSVDLATKLVKDIFVQDLVEIQLLNELILDRFVQFLKFHDLTDQMNAILTRAKLHNMNIFKPFCKSVPVWLEKPPFMNSDKDNFLLLNNIQESQNFNFQPANQLPIKPLIPTTSLIKPLIPTTSFTSNDQVQSNSYGNFNGETENDWSHVLFESPQRSQNQQPSSDDNVWSHGLFASTQRSQNQQPSSDDNVWSHGLFQSTQRSQNEQVASNNDTTLEDVMIYSSSGSGSEQASSISNKIESIEIDSDSSLENEVSVSNLSGTSLNKSVEPMETSLSDNEIKKLSEIINNSNCEELITAYNKYKNSSFNNSFVMNVIGFLKKKNTTVIYDITNRLIQGLKQQNSHFAYINNAESTLYLLAINIIALLNQNKDNKEAAKLLFQFKNSLDNLLNVQWFRSIQRYNLSDVGKYLYICQTFMRGEYLEEALNILKSPELRLLNPFNTWTLQNNENFDNEFRNSVVEEFIKIALKENLKIAKDIILHLITCKDNVTELNVWSYFDGLILALLNSNGLYLTDLVQMLPNILQGWYKYLKKPNMRGLLVQLTSAKIPEKQLLVLYSKCVKQHIYNKFKGNENSISLKTDMTLEEIFITFRYYLYKLEQNNCDFQEIRVFIKMPEQLSNQPQILINAGCRIQETKDRILTVLARCFPTAIVAQSNDESHIVIKPDQIKLCVEYYRKANNSNKSIWVRQSAVENLVNCDAVPTNDTFNYNSKLCSR